MVTMKARKKGGAVRPWALMESKPISFRIDGRNTGHVKEFS